MAMAMAMKEGRSPDLVLPGFRFSPTDEELVGYYLRRKAFRGLSHDHVIADLDLYNFEPWDLPGLAVLKSHDGQWFFFAPRERQKPGNTRNSRSTKLGYWKTTGKDRKIPQHCVEDHPAVGMKKTLVYYWGRAPRGTRTDWVMHEYRICEDYEKAHSLRSAFVVCKVFMKGGPGPRNGEQYGAPVPEDHSIEEAEERKNSKSSAMMIPSVSAPLLAAMKQEEEALLAFLMCPSPGDGQQSSPPKKGGPRTRNNEQYGTPAQEEGKIKAAEEQENSESSAIMILSIPAPLSAAMKQEEEALLAFFMRPLSGGGLEPSPPKKGRLRPRKGEQYCVPIHEDSEIEEAEEQESSESSATMIPSVSSLLSGATKQEEESFLAFLMHPLSEGGLQPSLPELNSSSDICFTKDSPCSDPVDELFADLPSLANNMLLVDQSGEEDAKILEEILQSAANNEGADQYHCHYYVDAMILAESNSNSFQIGSPNTKSMVKPALQYSFHQPTIPSSQVRPEFQSRIITSLRISLACFAVTCVRIASHIIYLLAVGSELYKSQTGEPSCHSSETVPKFTTTSRANSQDFANVSEGSISSNFPCSEGVSTHANDVCRQTLAFGSDSWKKPPRAIGMSLSISNSCLQRVFILSFLWKKASPTSSLASPHLP